MSFLGDKVSPATLPDKADNTPWGITLPLYLLLLVASYSKTQGNGQRLWARGYATGRVRLALSNDSRTSMRISVW
jgi:hypothetical protein